jgi:AAA domain
MNDFSPDADNNTIITPETPAPIAAKTSNSSPDLAAAQDFMALLCGDVTLCVMPPDGGGPSALRGPNALTQALARNASLNAYFVVNIVKPDINKKPTKGEIETIRAVGGDIDWDRRKFNGRFKEGMQELEDTVLPALIGATPQPSLIVFTGGGLQPIWLIEPLPNTPENRSRAEVVGEYIADRFGGDPVGNIDRILRLPGSVNHPKKDKRDAGQLTRRTKFTIFSGKRYRLEDLETAWAGDVLTHKSKPPRPQPPPRAPSVNDDLCGGMQERDAGETLFTCKELGPLIASVPNGPFSVRSKWRNPLTGETTDFGWLDWLYIMSGIADDDPSLEDQCKQLFDEVSDKAGGNTSQNDAQWNSQAGRKTRREAAGERVTTVGTLVTMWEMVESLAPPDPTPNPAPDPTPDPVTPTDPTLAGAGWWSTGRPISLWPDPDPLPPPDPAPASGLQFEDLGDLDDNPPPREWAFGVLLLYGDVTVIGAAGGAGKTSLVIGFELSAASGRAFLGHKVYIGPQRVLHISAEDDANELRRRYKAAARHHQITKAHFNNILIRAANTGDKRRIELMTMKGKNVEINKAGFARLRSLIQESQARIVTLEPLNHFVGGGLLDNTMMTALMGELKMVALEYDVAIIVIHHTNKGTSENESVDGIMGAKAITDFSRTSVRLMPMTAAEATDLGIPPEQERGVFRITWGKRNNAEDLAEERWYRKISVSLGNGVGCYPNGDSIGVVELFDVASAGSVGPDPIHVRIILRAVAAAPPDRLLSLAKNTARNYRKPVRAALRRAGVPMPQKGVDADAMVDRLREALEAGGLIRVEGFKDAGGRLREGLAITEAGRKRLNADDGDTPESETAGGEATPERDLARGLRPRAILRRARLGAV